MTIRIVIADDHAVVREGLRLLLDAQPDLEVVDIAADGHAAVRLVEQQQPDVVVMDIAMPLLNGIEATQQVRVSHPSVQVVILSMHAGQEYIVRALQAGALGYLLKESAGIEIVEAVRAVYAGRRYLSQRITNSVVESFLHLSQPGLESHPLARLSVREREVLQLVVEGKSSAEIAQLLSLSAKSVDSYRSRLMQKVAAQDLPTLVRFAIRHGIIPLE